MSTATHIKEFSSKLFDRAAEPAERLFDFLLGDFRWYRRSSGGHWEQWTIAPSNEAASGWDSMSMARTWSRSLRCNHGPSGERPQGAVGDPICEDYGAVPLPRDADQRSRVQMVLISPAEETQVTLYEPRKNRALLRGNGAGGGVDYVCGSCGRVLIQNAGAAQFGPHVGAKCPYCGHASVIPAP